MFITLLDLISFDADSSTAYFALQLSVNYGSSLYIPFVIDSLAFMMDRNIHVFEQELIIVPELWVSINSSDSDVLVINNADLSEQVLIPNIEVESLVLSPLSLTISGRKVAGFPPYTRASVETSQGTIPLTETSGSFYYDLYIRHWYPSEPLDIAEVRVIVIGSNRVYIHQGYCLQSYNYERP